MFTKIRIASKKIISFLSGNVSERRFLSESWLTLVNGKNMRLHSENFGSLSVFKSTLKHFEIYNITSLKTPDKLSR